MSSAFVIGGRWHRHHGGLSNFPNSDELGKAPNYHDRRVMRTRGRSTNGLAVTTNDEAVDP